VYTINPLQTITPDHTGFWFVFAFCIIFLVIVFSNEPSEFFGYFFISTICCLIVYGVSYHLTNQETQVFKNERVVGKFVSFQPEGYSEQSGKIRSDKHYMYVVFEVEGKMVIIQANESVPYPQSVTLYKN
jgi:hypothetical protein